MFTFRMVQLPDECSANKDVVCDGILPFEDGSLRGLAGMVVWIALLMTWRLYEDEMSHPQVVTLINSLLNIPAMLHSECTSDIDGTVSWIARQNVSAKTQPVSSFMWASILKELTGDKWAENSVQEMADLYNNHPSVVGDSGSVTAAEEGGSGGAGSIALDGKKKVAIVNWISKTGDTGWSHVESAGHDYPFNLGPYGEQFASSSVYFVGSKVVCSADASATMLPLDMEGYLDVDWNLPLTEAAQGMLFQRFRSDFTRHSRGIPIDKKKKYRHSLADGTQIRNVLCLWDQFKPHLMTRLPSDQVHAIETKLCESNVADDDWLVT